MDTVNPFVRLRSVRNAWVAIRNIEQDSPTYKAGAVLRGIIRAPKNGGHYHELMRAARPNDVVIHIQELTRGYKYLTGASVLASGAITRGGYYLISLRDTFWLPESGRIPIARFLKKYGSSIRKELTSVPENYPFVLRSDRISKSKRIVLAQRYFRQLTTNLANLILSDLKDLIKVEETEEEYYKNFESAVARALTLDREELRRRVSSMPEQPERVFRSISVFNRNPYVVAEVLRRAGVSGCEAEFCTNRSPFLKPNGLPFLEVHHKLPLAQGGLDTVENAIALCPNCHRKEHYGDLPD